MLEPFVPLGFVLSWPSGVEGGCLLLVIGARFEATDGLTLASCVYAGGIGIVAWLSITIRGGNRLSGILTSS